jgi:hypothetical protein
MVVLLTREPGGPGPRNVREMLGNCKGAPGIIVR